MNDPRIAGQVRRIVWSVQAHSTTGRIALLPLLHKELRVPRSTLHFGQERLYQQGTLLAGEPGVDVDHGRNDLHRVRARHWYDSQPPLLPRPSHP